MYIGWPESCFGVFEALVFVTAFRTEETTLQSRLTERHSFQARFSLVPFLWQDIVLILAHARVKSFWTYSCSSSSVPLFWIRLSWSPPSAPSHVVSDTRTRQRRESDLLISESSVIDRICWSRSLQWAFGSVELGVFSEPSDLLILESSVSDRICWSRSLQWAFGSVDLGVFSERSSPYPQLRKLSLRASQTLLLEWCGVSSCLINYVLNVKNKKRYIIIISNLSDDRSTASSKTIPPLNAI
jgi:hypothetical protein